MMNGVGGGQIMNGHGPPLQQRPIMLLGRISKIVVITTLCIIGILVGLQGKVLFVTLPQRINSNTNMNSGSGSVTTTSTTSMGDDNEHNNNKRNSKNNIRQKEGQSPVCRWYLAESALPNAGLGVYTSIGLHKSDIIGNYDICIFVSDAPKTWTHLRSHSFGTGSFFGQYESNNNRAACEGFTTIYNTVPTPMVNTELVSPTSQNYADLHRQTSPGAGAITHHFGIHGIAKDIILAGSELTIDYGDWDFSSTEEDEENALLPRRPPHRPVPWLQQHGWCVDNIDIRLSHIEQAGRGAFAKRRFHKGDIVAPAPLQVFSDIDMFANQLFLNYCIQPILGNKNDEYNNNNSSSSNMNKMFFFPYGPAVNLINHDAKHPNVQFQWSSHPLHHASWLDLPLREFWKVVYPGGLILEVVALRDIDVDEELVLDYGSEWDQAWKEHVRNWKKQTHDHDAYVYPSEMDETLPLRTIQEQRSDPYPPNLTTMCVTADWIEDRRETNHRNRTWREPTAWSWYEGMAFCRIWDRIVDHKSGKDLYNVELIFSNDPKDLVHSGKQSSSKRRGRYWDFQVPRRAIRFVEIPYMDDEHLPNAFRRPIGLPVELVPESWK